jgi:hypothetical protein
MRAFRPTEPETTDKAFVRLRDAVRRDGIVGRVRSHLWRAMEGLYAFLCYFSRSVWLVHTQTGKTAATPIDGEPGSVFFAFVTLPFVRRVGNGLLDCPYARMATALCISAAPRAPAYGQNDLYNRNLMWTISVWFFSYALDPIFRCHFVRVHCDSHSVRWVHGVEMGRRRAQTPDQTLIM